MLEIVFLFIGSADAAGKKFFKDGIPEHIIPEGSKATEIITFQTLQIIVLAFSFCLHYLIRCNEASCITRQYIYTPTHDTYNLYCHFSKKHANEVSDKDEANQCLLTVSVFYHL